MGDLEKEMLEQIASLQPMDAMVRKVFLTVPEPSLKDNRGDLDRVRDALEKEHGILHPFVSLQMTKNLSEILHASDFQVTVTLAQSSERWEMIDIEPGDHCIDNYGLAVDLGSTNMIFYLLDLHRGALIERISHENPQVQHGEDILTRIHHCENPDGLKELQSIVIQAFNQNIQDLLRRHGMESRHIYAFSVAGNTTMIHLFCGLSPSRICREPYIPVVNRPDIYPARSLGLEGNDNAVIYFLPNVGSYVGGDVLAGVLVSGMHQDKDLCLLVDVGTNAEIILGNRNWLMVAAGAAGPALEGGVVKCGMRAAQGAIEKIRIDRQTHRPDYTTIGKVAPQGICGSGLIDLMAELFASRIIDERGKIVVQEECIVESDGVKAYRIVPKDKSGTGKEIIITELDINNLLRTKGAMYTALTVIARYAGVSFQDLIRFYVAGTFGATIDPQKAVTIGMVPDIPLDRYKALYNSAGIGACFCLFSKAKQKELEEISRKITYVELNVNGDFMNLLNAAMFLPHTDTTQFPSVVRSQSKDAG